MKLKSLVTSRQKIKEVGVVAKQESVTLAPNIECTCKIQWCTILMISSSTLGLVFFVILKWFRGHLFSNAVKIMLFISDVQYYVQIKLCRMAESIHLFKVMGTLTPEM